jgi:hypothetical protein
VKCQTKTAFERSEVVAEDIWILSMIMIDEFGFKIDNRVDIPLRDLLSPVPTFADVRVCLHWIRMPLQLHHHRILNRLDSEQNVI